MKSTKLVMIELEGIINLGKYTLVKRAELVTKLSLAVEKAVEKNCQGNNPANTNIAYGVVPSDFIPATFSKTIVKTIIVKNGLKNAQIIPITVCL